MKSPHWLPLVLLPLCASSLAAQRLSSRSQGEAMRRVWAPVVAVARHSVVTVEVDESERALGTAVAKELVLTKFSELRLDAVPQGAAPALRCMLGERSLPALLVGFDQVTDLALLRVAGLELRPLQWGDEPPAVGALLASPGGEQLPRGVGVLSVEPYVHTKVRAFLGVRFADGGNGEARIAEAIANGAAHAAGLGDGDLVLRFGTAEIDNAQALRDQLARCQPGDRVAVDVRREDEIKTFDVVLGSNNNPEQSDQEAIWGPLSTVRSGFELVLQHDTVLEPRDMGGPVIGLDGCALGINIARAGRVETLALPAATAQRVIKKLLDAERRRGDTGR